MAYEGGLLADPTGFSRLKIPQKWLWAWDGLVFCMPMWEASGGPVDLVANLTPASINGTITPTPSFVNYEQTFAASSYYYFGDTTQFASPLYGDMTIAAMHSPLSTGQTAIWCYATEGSANAPFVLVYSLGSNSKYAIWNDNNVNGPETTATYAVGTRNFVIGRRVGDHAASPTMDIMVNGSHKVTSTGVTLDPFWNNDGGGVVYNQAINRFGSYNGYMGNCRLGPIYVWNRALKDVEIDALWADPYGPIRQVLQEYSFLSQASSTTNVTATPTAGSLAITGYAPTATSGVVLAGDVPSALTLAPQAASVTSSPDALTPASQSVALSGLAATVSVTPDPPVYVAVGTLAAGDHTTAITPGLPAGIAAGDLLFTIAFLRNAGTLSVSSGWTQHSLVDTTQNGIGYYLQTWYRIATGSDTAATVTPSGGSTSPQSLTSAFTLGFRNVHQTSPFGIDGADTFNAISTDIGPITAATPVEPVGAVVVFGVRTGTVGSAIATLSGDSLTWVEAVEQFSTVNGLGISVACDYAIWSGGAATITSKTYTITGGASAPGMGKMFLINAPSAAGGVEALPTTGSVAITGYAPTVISSPDSLTPAAGSVTLTGFAPDVSLGAGATPGAGSVTLTGYAPALIADHVLAADVGSLTIAGQAASATISVDAAPPAGALVITGYEPDVSNPDAIIPVGVGSVVLAFLGATESAGATAAPGAQSVTLTGQAPVASSGVDVGPSVGTTAITGLAASSTSDGMLAPDAGVLTLTGFAASVGNDTEASPGAGDVTLTGLAPDVSCGHALTPATQALSIAGFEPTLVISNIVVADTGALTITGFEPAATLTEAFPGTGSLGITGYGATLSADAIVTPGTGVLVIGYPGGALGSPGIPMQYVNTPDLTPSTPRWVWTH